VAGTSQYHIIRASALYDVVATIGFAPPFAAATLLMLRNLDTNFNVLGGIPSFENAQLFFANILGIIAGLGGSAHCQTTLVLWHGGFHWPGRIYGDHGVLRNNARC